MTGIHRFRSRLAVSIALAAALPPGALAQGAGTIVYRCPGNIYTSDRELSARQAQEQGCKAIEGAPLTIVESPPRRAQPASAAAPPPPPRGAETRVDPGAQRQRDGEARRILEAELRREEEQLALLKREYNNGEPERRGEERNYQRYLDRVAELKASIARKEGDIAAIRRELGKLAP